MKILQMFSFHMTSERKSFNVVSNYVKKVERVSRDSHAKALSKKNKNSGNF